MLRAQRAAEALAPSSVIKEVLSGGATPNRQYLVSADGKEFVLRCCRRTRDRSRLKFIARVATAMSECGLPAPRSLGLWQDELDSWQLWSRLEGTHFQYDRPRQLKAAGRALGRLHSFSPQLLQLAAPVVAHDVPLDGWREPQARIRTAAATVMGPSRQLIHRFSEFAAAAATGASLSQNLCLTHGDWHGLNLLFRDDDLSGICDLDAIDIRPRAADVAYGLLMLGRTSRGDHQLCPNRMRLFLDAYQSEATALVPEEAEAIVDLMVISQLPDPGHLGALTRAELPVDEELTGQYRAIGRIREQSSLIREVLS